MEQVKQDGRFKRSARSRETIINAMISLIEEGQYIPTAQQVADKAQISIRTVFRHFTEMEELYKEIDDAVRPSYVKHFVIDCDLSGSLEDRIELLIESRLKGHHEIYQLSKATHALLWRSEVITETYHTNQKLLRSLMFKILPELKEKDQDIIEMADAIVSFENFDRFYTYQKLTVEQCERIFCKQLKLILLG